jgi:D-alanyl-D-alanine carboxypeptidase (penicillin-binding protein 5/6)
VSATACCLAALWPSIVPASTVAAGLVPAGVASAGISWAQGPRTQTGLPAHAPTAPTAPPAKGQLPEARSYVLVDANTGDVLAGYHERVRAPPASLTKVLTALIAVGYLTPRQSVAGTAISESAYPNRVGMEKGVGWPLGEVLASLLVYSANDAAYALAQRVGGSLAGFVPIMQLAARQMGMADHPVLRDPAGLDGSEGFRGGNLVSARDLAVAAATC